MKTENPEVEQQQHWNEPVKQKVWFRDHHEKKNHGEICWSQYYVSTKKDIQSLSSNGCLSVHPPCKWNNNNWVLNWSLLRNLIVEQPWQIALLKQNVNQIRNVDVLLVRKVNML